MANHQMRSAVSPSKDEALDSLFARRFEFDEASQDWLIDLIEPFASRCVVPAQCSLFAAGDVVQGYFAVLSGELLVHRRQSSKHKPTIRIMTRGDLFIYDAADRHSADCDAVTGSVVLRIERQRLDELAGFNPDLADVLRVVHASELAMLLDSLAAQDFLPGSPKTGGESDNQPDFENRLLWPPAGQQWHVA